VVELFLAALLIIGFLWTSKKAENAYQRFLGFVLLVIAFASIKIVQVLQEILNVLEAQ